jgi:hypothetical protein
MILGGYIATLRLRLGFAALTACACGSRTGLVEGSELAAEAHAACSGNPVSLRTGRALRHSCRCYECLLDGVALSGPAVLKVALSGSRVPVTLASDKHKPCGMDELRSRVGDGTDGCSDEGTHRRRCHRHACLRPGRPRLHRRGRYGRLLDEGRRGNEGAEIGVTSSGGGGARRSMRYRDAVTQRRNSRGRFERARGKAGTRLPRGETRECSV